MALVRCGSTCEDDTVQTSRSAKLHAGKIGTVQQPCRGSTRAVTSITPHFPNRVLPKLEGSTSTHPRTAQIHSCWKRRQERRSWQTMSKFRGDLCCTKLATGRQASTGAGQGRAEVLTSFSFGELGRVTGKVPFRRFNF